MILEYLNEKQPHFTSEGVDLKKLYGFDSKTPPPSGTSGSPSKVINDPDNNTTPIYMTPLQLQSIYIAAGFGAVLLFFVINNSNRRY